MPAPKIGSNAAIMSSRAQLDFFLGQKVDTVINGLHLAHDAKLMLDTFSDTDLKAMGYGDGTSGTANEIGYLRSAMIACADLDNFRLGLAPSIAYNATTPHNYQGDLMYASPQ